MKKLKNFVAIFLISVITMLIVILAGCSSESGSKVGSKKEFETGEGTVESPYIIAKDYQWKNINNHLNAYFKLQNDIYLEDLGTIKPIGSNEKPFEGVIDGNGYAVSNAVIANDDECGLFGCISGGEVRNLKFANSSLSLNVTNDGAYTGSFVANLKKGSLIENCHTKGIKMTETAHGNILGYPKFYVAGFVGIIQSASKIYYCSCDVVSNAKGNRVICESGFVGKMNGGEIDACYSAGSFDANPSTTGGTAPSNRIGGFVYTFSAGKISNVYTETVFNYVGYAGMFTYEEMDELEYILSFIEFEQTSKNVGTNMYYTANTVNNTITSSAWCRYYGPNDIETSNKILETEVWSNNSIWMKGKMHPVFVSYERYKEIRSNV